MAKINQKYLSERVQDEMYKARRRSQERYAAKHADLRKRLIKEALEECPDVVGARKKILVLDKKTKDLQAYIGDLSKDFSERFPYLGLTERGEVAWKGDRVGFSTRIPEVEELQEQAREEVRDIDNVCTAFLDQVMLGEATYEEFSSLLSSLLR